jgi:hypothetical protein
MLYAASLEIKKDPGVPNLHPLKAQILQQYANRKEKLAEVCFY